MRPSLLARYHSGTRVGRSTLGDMLTTVCKIVQDYDLNIPEVRDITIAAKYTPIAAPAPLAKKSWNEAVRSGTPNWHNSRRAA